MNKIEIYNQEYSIQKFNTLRRDIVDRNGIIISRNIKSFHAAINPSYVNNKENLLIKLKLIFPELSIKSLENKILRGKYFYLKKRITQTEKEN